MTDNQLPGEQTRLTVDNIIPVPASANPEAGALAYNLEIQKAQVEKLKLANDALRQDIEHRNKWAKRLLPVCIGWVAIVAAAMGLEGFHVWGFHLDNSVLNVFIGATTADVLGLGYIVVKYLFPNPPQ